MSVSTRTAPDTHPAHKGVGRSVRFQRIAALILLFAQGGITVTGSLVRVTGSGLGCDTWPLCHEGSLVPVAGAAPWIHQAIEFGNRLLTFVLAAIALVVFIAVLRAKRRREILVLSFVSGLGIIVQAILGGISVLLDLQWWSVAIHFLPSMVLVWIAALLYMRIAEPDDAPQVQRFSNATRVWTVVAAIALSVVLFTGTMVTGSGPHSGDAGVGMEGRLELDTEMLAYVHAGCMYLYLAATLVVVFLLWRQNAPQDARRTALVLIAMIVVQWAVGVAQFYLGVPRWTVPVHIGLSSVVVAFSAFLYAHGRRRQYGERIDDTPAMQHVSA
ncbi:COX15/CtaA family protein [Corynebacterium pilosum]|uniref:Cytochrome aa3 controlling protein n=1 Tax=Corynebacterium pilosum TaxID=35756 RepID=A0A376CQB8_9CORY|nr:heme A synthase [Corynebacterium pilosum]STC70495.1 cytochrome aa3 controlling protein [Corynebacterium pilosum]